MEKLPREYGDWRADETDREEDAAYNFGFHLIRHCRDEVLAKVPADVSPEVKATAEQVVDAVLCSVCDLLEGFWPLECGPKHRLSLSLTVQVHDVDEGMMGEVLDRYEITPCKLDLPIGYWKWKHREFR